TYSPAFFLQAEDGIRGRNVTGVQPRALPISSPAPPPRSRESTAPKPLASRCARRSPNSPGPATRIPPRHADGGPRRSGSTPNGRSEERRCRERGESRGGDGALTESEEAADST